MAKGPFDQTKLAEFTARLRKDGLHTNLKIQLDKSIGVVIGTEALALGTNLQNQIWKLMTEQLSDRFVVDFAQELLNKLNKAAERDNIKPKRSKFGTRSAGASGPNRQIPHDVKEVLLNLEDFIDKNKSPFKFNTQTLMDMAVAVAEKGEEICESLGLSEDELWGLANVSLYDIHFLCDDSGSMQIRNRKEALVRTLQSVAYWAAKLEPRGISIRFINFEDPGDSSCDGLVTIDNVKDACHKTKLEGETELAKALEDKILGRISRDRKAAESSPQYQGLEKPAIVAIITDGQPTDFHDSDFEEDCDDIDPMGKADETEEFMKMIRADSKIKSVIYCSERKLEAHDPYFHRHSQAKSTSAPDSDEDSSEDDNEDDSEDGNEDGNEESTTSKLSDYQREILHQFISAVRECHQANDGE
ncbi:hypothetical protein AOL_s00081g233 [Orbilia oligospora ATCC 24927]|uniref:VWFA domain-containing protein n=1 Tax=Arthrobotrys oligospora (strain ATCC 24927 / CBS 115.81 / DSM 1491) TaxID=756982 RepID=G1XFU0_ARTOA|nr:hypothetical protein AOL_s00081g233 [Orbilia oligospora ATCC 24927]EGX47906.1 hypothetical protein AOL_s00081g233 [Orbilia oligospora ATCC 24927]